MKRQLYLECYSGISGDMTVAALLDLGADEQVLRKALASLPVDGFDIAITRKVKSGLDVCDFDVILDTEHENHDHDMEYLHGHDHDHEHPHNHTHDGEEHPHDHEHSHEHVHEDGSVHTHDHHHAHHDHVHEHHHEHRGLHEILHIIDHADMTDRAKETATRIFQILAEAESKAHGVPADQVHFHEVGAVDSIVDILSVAVCLDNLDITEVIVPFLCEGQGTIRCQHGIIPVPVPAVVNVVQAHGITLKPTGVQGELVTPTGAAIVAAVRTSEQLPQTYRIAKIGMGAGKREYEGTGVLRAMLLESGSVESADTIWRLESNLDDCSGEVLGFVMDELFTAGARDVYYTPIYMKKSRPAVQINIICRESDIEKLQNVLFRNTTTIGVRRCRMERTVLPRELRQVDTPYGKIQVKVCQIGEEVRAYPEYASVAELCKTQNMSFQEAWRIASAVADTVKQ